MRSKILSFLIFFLILAINFHQIHIVRQAFADEPYKSSMEWLSLQSKETPVGEGAVSGETTDVPDVYVAPAPSVLEIPQLSELLFEYPLAVKPVITTTFSAEHPGVDFAVPIGTQIVAAESGLVTTAGWDTTGYGQTVVLHESTDTYTRYAHLSELQVSIGQYIMKGMPVGLVGSTGRSTGPHLHFEIRIHNQFVDPLSLVTF